MRFTGRYLSKSIFSFEFIVYSVIELIGVLSLLFVYLKALPFTAPF